MHRKILWGGGVALALLFAPSLFGQGQTGIGGQVVSSSPGPFKVPLPLDDQVAFEKILVALAARINTPVGIERVRAGQLPEPVHGNSRIVDFSGLKFADAIEQLIEATPPLRGASAGPDRTFTWSENDGIVHATLLGGHKTFLDQEIPELELSGVSVTAVVAAVHRAVDPTYTLDTYRPQEVYIGGSAEPVRVLEKPISLSLRSVTLRQVLDAAVKAHGLASWIVVYGSSSGNYSHCDIRISTFGGRDMTLSARK